MLRRLTGAALGAVLSAVLDAVLMTGLAAILSIAVAGSNPVQAASMQFSLHREEPSSCIGPCRVWVSADGLIQADTLRAFEDFAARHDLQGMTLVLNSEGGSVHGALALGRAIRRLDMTTTIGRGIGVRDGVSKNNGAPKNNSSADMQQAILSPRADCESMCAFVLLAGVKRIVPEEARVRVHQIWLGDRREDAVAANYSAEDLALIQRDIGRIAQYTSEMGGGAELLEIALRIPPWEPMRALTRAELRRSQLDNSEAATPALAASVASDAPPVTTGSLRRTSASAAEGGWSIQDRAGRVTLTRSHPLTAEGEELGRFEVSLACGDRPDIYAVTYRETRLANDDGQLPQPLKGVQFRLGQKDVALALQPDGAPDAIKRETLARGELSAAMFGGFADSSRSLRVTTESRDGVSTNIRIGNAGVAKYLPQLAASCAPQNASVLP